MEHEQDDGATYPQDEVMEGRTTLFVAQSLVTCSPDLKLSGESKISMCGII